MLTDPIRCFQRDAGNADALRGREQDAPLMRRRFHPGLHRCPGAEASSDILQTILIENRAVDGRLLFSVWSVMHSLRNVYTQLCRPGNCILRQSAVHL